MHYPVAFSHVGITVTDIDAAIDWYREILGCRLVIGPIHGKHDGSHFGEVCRDIFGERFSECKLAHVSTSNGVSIELFEFVEPKNEVPEDNFEYWKNGTFHFCLVDPDIEGLAKRIDEAGGKQRSKVWPVFPGEDYKAVYCQDPWGNIIEIYNASTEQIFSNR